MLKSGNVSASTPNSDSSSGSSSLITDIIQGTTGVGAVTAIPNQLQETVSGLENIGKEQYNIVTPARKLTSLLPSGRLIIDVNNAIKNPESKDNITLREGDVIVIPQMSATVSVTGAVIQPSSLIYSKDYNLNDYVKMTGGYSRDADEKAVYVIKANGMVIKGDKTKLAPGDIIVIPTKVMVQKVTDRLGQLLGFAKFAIGIAATAFTLRLILK
jgi:protein involved in polysaccharide export with SLBB domain